LWVDYNLESTIPGLFVLGEANFSDHGANRLGASALMQGLADGDFVSPYTIGHHIATSKLSNVDTDHPAFTDAESQSHERMKTIINVGGRRSVDSIHRDLGAVMWNQCGMSRNATALKECIEQVRNLREEFWSNVKVLGTGESFNQNLEHAGRLADFLEFAELLAEDALHRNESCGGHFREEAQLTEDDPEVKSGLTTAGEAKRDDENFAYVAAWEFNGVGEESTLHKEPLSFEYVPLGTRSYK